MVAGVDAAGKAVAGMVVMIHAHADPKLPNLAVSQAGKLVGDLKSEDFDLAKAAPGATAEVKESAPIGGSTAE